MKTDENALTFLPAILPDRDSNKGAGYFIVICTVGDKIIPFEKGGVFQGCKGVMVKTAQIDTNAVTKQ